MTEAAEAIRAYAQDPIGRRDRVPGEIMLGRAELMTLTCGDRLELRVARDGEGRLRITWSGRGCELSRGSASLLTAELDGLSASEMAQRSDRFLAAMGRRETSLPGAETFLLVVAANPVRSVCATLAWRALGQALSGAGLGSPG
ncbi:iron-sulfur cluster assembly scaffold protein [Rathayibacter toxicus]|uniref:iron-sulfur cluster assembly scaffold protein n=1 Tax=Rathayibacter toxicus TaxID=145458 RepID=UPI001C056321|nr:hypothetical protein [Rathayibacter toxicus]QWL32465.1 hypothetical protein E2R35_06245 [Rathayibacter toxicus]QWL34559.1 hypothetical protein E2R36_06250 [Rathayibacter toxicus]QWL36691.1 hypothetical protein E2R37_06245 [Rathayibacter toxicus]QWL38780.1 hypothetical protein E2R38_06240 [Rathayibacter toxicus]QWL40868.1 hypothetical protein E2R39_06245 [Rathayibacter toxicus]